MRCVKILLLKGGRRDATNNRGQKPIDAIRQGRFENEMMQDLRPPSFWKCFMISVPLAKMEKEWSTVIFFITMFSLMLLGSVIFVYPLMSVSSRPVLWTLDIILVVLTSTFY